MKKILLLSNIRESSTRCPNKMCRKFGDTTLTDLLLTKMEKLSKNKLFNDTIIAVNMHDKNVWDIAHSYNVKVQLRSYFSARYGKLLSDIHHYLKEYDQEYVFWINGSLPFLTTDTIIDATNEFMEKDIKSMHPAKRRYNWFWIDNKVINVSNKSHTRTQDSDEIYESVHAFHIFNRKYMLNNDAYWDFSLNNPYLYKIDDTVEFLDINSEKDFRIAEVIYESKNNRSR